MPVVASGALAALSWFAAVQAIAAPSPPLFAIIGPAAGPDSASCELHIWPSKQLETVVEGGWGARPVRSDAAAAGKPGSGIPSVLLAPDRQKMLMPADRIASAFGLTGVQVIVHDTPLPRATLDSPAPFVDPAPPCLREVVIRRTFFERGFMSAPSVRIYGTVRGWNDGKLSWTWTGFGDGAATAFPPKTPEEMPDAILSLETGWGTAVRLLADRGSAGH